MTTPTRVGIVLHMSNHKIAADLIAGDRVEGQGVVVGVVKETAKTVVIHYIPFPEYIARNGVKNHTTAHKKTTLLELRG